jgi:20S proteasome alpha/beta subunit
MGNQRQQLLLMMIMLMLMLMMIQKAQGGHSETLIGIQGKDFVLLAADRSMGSGGAVLTSQEFDKIQPFPAAASSTAAVAGMGDNPADIDHVLQKLQVGSRLAAISSSNQRNTMVFDCSAGQHMDTLSQQQPQLSAGWTIECIAEALRYEVYNRLRSDSPMQGCAFLIAGMLRQQRQHFNDDHQRDSSPNTDITNVHQQIQIASKEFRNVVDDMDLVHHQISSTSSEDITEAGAAASNNLRPVLFWLDQYGALQKVTYGAHGHAASLLWSVLDRGWRSNMTVEEAIELLDDCLQRLKERFLFNPSQKFCIKCIDQNGCRRLQ